MYRAECSACNRDVDATPPDRGYWVLIVSFWVFSLLFGIGAALGPGWGFMLLLAWLLLATTTGMLVRHATAWTCSDCGATVSPPPLPGQAAQHLPTHAHDANSAQGACGRSTA